jgi:hypothetical protein
MNSAAATGLRRKEQMKGATMEAHAGTITIGARRTTKPRRRRLVLLRERMRRRRLDRAERAYSMRASGISAPSVPGSEHTHLLRQRGF